MNSSIFPSSSPSSPINEASITNEGLVRTTRWKNAYKLEKRKAPTRIKPRNKYWTYLLTLNGNGAPPVYKQKQACTCRNPYTPVEGGSNIQRARESNARAVLCAINIHDLCIYRFTRACLCSAPSARVCVHAHVCLRMHVHAYGRTCARDIRGYQSYAKLQTETAPLQPLPSLFPEGQICIHTTSHTTRFNISGHGWKLSPETQADARGTIGLANAAIFAIAPVSGVSRRKRDCQERSSGDDNGTGNIVVYQNRPLDDLFDNGIFRCSTFLIIQCSMVLEKFEKGGNGRVISFRFQ